METEQIKHEVSDGCGLVLPPVETRLKLPSSMTFYGADDVLLKHCGIKAGEVAGQFRWQHGWCSRDRQNIDPIMLIKEPTIDPAKTYLVARQDEEAYLRIHCLNSQAIGLPFAYAQPLEAERIPNSLLVMPAHSLDYTKHQWKFDDYAEQIVQIADRFDRVVVCVHAACARKGYWLPHFQERGIECVIGADAFDVNGLVRIKTLLHQFEFMTTNILGSHLAYSAAAGNRISIYGDYAGLKAADFEHSDLYNLNPHVLDPILKLHSHEYAKATYPQFFCQPDQASGHLKWGLAEIGQGNVLSPAEMKKLMGWDFVSKTRRRARAVSRRLSRPSEQLLKNLMGRRRKAS